MHQHHDSPAPRPDPTRPRTARRAGVVPRDTPKYRRRSSRRRRRPGGGPRDADEVPDSQAPPRALRPADGRLRRRRRRREATGAPAARRRPRRRPPPSARRSGDDVDYALQAEPRGTGDAVAAAVAALPDDVDEVLVLSGDVPLVEAGLLRELLDERRLDEAAIALIAVDADRPGRPRPRRPRRGRDRRPDRRAQGRDRGGARGHRDQLRPVRVRRGLAARPGSARSSRRRRPASCT